MGGSNVSCKGFLCQLGLIVFVCGAISGCAAHEDDTFQNKNNFTNVSSERPIDQSLANKVEKELIKEKDISKVRAVNTNKELLLAIKTPQFDRLHLKKIEKRVTSDLKDEYPHYKVTVSTDQKLFLELNKLEQKIQQNNVNKKKLLKEFSNLKKLMKEKT